MRRHIFFKRTFIATVFVFVGSLSQIIQAQDFHEIIHLEVPADLVQLEDNKLFIAAEATLTIFDISKLDSPQRLSSYEFPEKIWDFSIIGTHVYVAADFFGLGILDISDPINPELIGSVKTPGQAKDVEISGATALLADHMSGVDLVDITDPETPTAIGSVYLDGYGRDVAASGTIGYAVDDPSGFYVIDLQERDSWEPLSAIQSANGPRIVEIEDDLALLVGKGTLQIYDISNPTAPTHRSNYGTPGGAHRAVLFDNHAYVADGKMGLLVVDLNNPLVPTVAASYRHSEPVRDVAVYGNLVVIAVGPLPTGIRRSQGGGGVILLNRGTQQN
tara:strand:+ start:696 stop:1691 length:996 start_codon:yes stop_codon:yes gene_type:complete